MKYSELELKLIGIRRMLPKVKDGNKQLLEASRAAVKRKQQVIKNYFWRS